MNPLSWHLTLKDFRVYKALDLSPEGVSVLAAPNGAGKTTLNNALQLLGALFTRDMETALSLVSPRLLRHVRAPSSAPVELSLSVGDVTWRLRLPVDSQGLTGRYGEELLHGEQMVVRAAMHQKEWYHGSLQRTMPLDERRCCTRIIWDEERPPWLEPLQRMLTTLRVHEHYHLNRLSEPWQRGGRHTFLHPTGSNLWTVLDNWKGSRAMSARYNWVLQQARLAFPHLISDIDFSPFLSIYRPDAPDQGMPPELLAAGLLTGLAHLTAVAGAEDGATLTFDEVEDALHPHAIRSILHGMEEVAETRGLTILLTTHSPVVLNHFKGKESSIYIIERSGNQPPPRSDVVALDQAREARWLAHFEPGDLYAAEDIAAQGGPGSEAG